MWNKAAKLLGQRRSVKWNSAGDRQLTKPAADTRPRAKHFGNAPLLRTSIHISANSLYALKFMNVTRNRHAARRIGGLARADRDSRAKE